MYNSKWILRPLIACIALFTGAQVMAQDIHVSQFYETPMMRNPALAGIFTGDIRVQALHRNQWSWTGFPFKTTALSGEYKFPVGRGEDFMTLGVQGYYDLAGSTRLRTTQLSPVLNYHKSLSSDHNEYLSAGFMVGMVQRQFDAHNLTFDYQYLNGNYSAGNPTGENFAAYNRNFVDVSAGLSYSNEAGEAGNYYLGVSLAHVNKPTETFKQERIVLPAKFQFNAGLHMNFDDQLSLQTELNYATQAGFNELMLGALVGYEFEGNTNAYGEPTTLAISGGLMARVKDALIPVVKMRYQQFELGVSYDVNLSSLQTASKGRGGFELTLSYRAFTRASEESGRLRCPRF